MMSTDVHFSGAVTAAQEEESTFHGWVSSNYTGHCRQLPQVHQLGRLSAPTTATYTLRNQHYRAPITWRNRHSLFPRQTSPPTERAHPPLQAAYKTRRAPAR